MYTLKKKNKKNKKTTHGLLIVTSDPYPLPHKNLVQPVGQFWKMFNDTTSKQLHYNKKVI